VSDTKDTRYCCDCCHLIGNRTYLENAKGWKCGHEKNIDASTIDVVIGMPINQYKTLNVYATRGDDQHCGWEGKWYVEYIKPHFYNPQTGEKSPLPEAKPKRVSVKGVTADDL